MLADSVRSSWSTLFTAEGFEIDEDILTEKVKETRAMYESAVLTTQQGEVGEMKGYIEAVGKDRFWNEIYREKLRQRFVIGEWRVVEVRNFAGNLEPTGKDWEAALYPIEQEALEKAKVLVVDASLLKTTVADALDYMTEYNRVLHTID